MNKLADKALTLLSLGLLFYPTPINETISAAILKKGDKAEKLNKSDLTVFNEFNYGNPRFIVPIKGSEDFKNMGFDNSSDLMNQQKESLLAGFQDTQQLNNLSCVLKLYSSIKVQKLAKLMTVSEGQLKELIELYQARNKSPPGSNPFEATVVKRLIDSIPQIEIIIEEDNIKINESTTKPDFAKIFFKNMQKIDEMTKEIDKI